MTSITLLAAMMCVLGLSATVTAVPYSQCPPCPCAQRDNTRFDNRWIGGNPSVPSSTYSKIDQQSRNMNSMPDRNVPDSERRPEDNQQTERTRSSAGQELGGKRQAGQVTNPADAIAFSGTRNTSQYFFQAGPVIFDNVITNIGGGYDPRYGVFTAFEPGIYLVRYNVVSQRNSSKNAVVDLLKNDKVVDSATGSGPSGETSNSAVLFLTPHDMLSVQGRAESAIFCGEDGENLCSFNVVLLKLGRFTDTKVARKVPGW